VIDRITVIKLVSSFIHLHSTLSAINLIPFRFKGVDCGSPQAIINANPVFSTTLYGDTVRYECNLGYELVGNDILTCGSDQSWAGVTPACQGRN